jgi:hypothetical protein
MRAWLAGSALAALALAPSPVRAAGCVRPTSNGGFEGFDYGSETVHSFGNASVLVWYVTGGPNAVNASSSRSDGVPDDVAEVAQVTSDALASYAAMGFHAPPSDAVNPSCGPNGGDGRFDVYLFDMQGADGFTAVESGRCTSSGSALQCASFIVAQADFSRFAAYYPTSSVGIHTVLPHETFHAVQNAYNTNLERFWAEGTAQWAAKVLDPSLDDLERFLPDFFAEPTRSLDAPVTGVTSAFLYGAAIWPVFLTQRHGDDIVRRVLENEALAGATAVASTDVVLQAEGSSLAAEFPLFAAWNAATGTRAGTGGYTHASAYPLVQLKPLPLTGAQAITSGLATYDYTLSLPAPMQLQVTTDPSRNAARFIPLQAGHAQFDQIVEITATPTTVSGDGVVLVSGITSKKTDAPFHLVFSELPDAGPPDAGPPDAGEVDAGEVDAGPVDAGLPDAGAGPHDPEPKPGTTGGCATAPTSPGDLGVLLAGALAWLHARRRR